MKDDDKAAPWDGSGETQLKARLAQQALDDLLEISQLIELEQCHSADQRAAQNPGGLQVSWRRTRPGKSALVKQLPSSGLTVYTGRFVAWLRYALLSKVVFWRVKRA